MVLQLLGWSDVPRLLLNSSSYFNKVWCNCIAAYISAAYFFGNNFFSEANYTGLLLAA
jgi:hypothetical protein